MPQIPDRVIDTEINVRFEDGCTIHRFFDSPQPHAPPREEIWVRDRVIGNGGFGTVWLEKSLNIDTGILEERAVKALPLGPGIQILHYSRELEALAKFSQKKFAIRFVKSFGWYQAQDTLCISLEYLPLGDLQTYLTENNRLPENETKEIAHQVLLGLEFMHDANFAHRDLKPANILIKNCPPDIWWVKLSDFGLSKRMTAAGAPSTVKGTPGFIAPDLLTNTGFELGFDDPSILIPSPKDISCPADMWALGETAFRLMAGHVSFRSSSHLLRYYHGLEEFPASPLEIAGASAMAKDLVIKVMAAKPADRLDVKGALTHLWFRSQSSAPATPDRGSISMEKSSGVSREISEEYREWSTRDYTSQSQSRTDPPASNQLSPLPVASSSSSVVDDDLTARKTTKIHDLTPLPVASSSSSVIVDDLTARKTTKIHDLTPGNWTGSHEPMVNFLNKERITMGDFPPPIQLRHSEHRIERVAFSPDSKWLVTVAKDTVMLWNLSSQNIQITQTRTIANATFNDIAYSSDSLRVGLASSDGKIRIANIREEMRFRTIYQHTHEVLSMAFSPVTESIFFSSVVDIARLLDIESGQIIGKMKSKSQGAVLWVSFMEIYNRFVPISVCRNGILHTWKKSLNPFSRDTWSPASTQSLGIDTTLVVGDASSLTIATISGPLACVWQYHVTQFGFGGMFVCTATIDHQADWIKSMSLYDSGPAQLAVLATCSRDGLLHFWKQNPSGETPASAPFLCIPADNQETHYPIQFSADGRWFVSTLSDGHIQLHDSENFTRVERWGQFLNNRSFSTVSPDGKKVLSKGSPYAIWDLERAILLGCPPISGEIIFSSFSADSEFLITIDDKNIATIFSSETGQDLKRMQFHNQDGQAPFETDLVTVSQNFEYAATTSQEWHCYVIYLWDLEKEIGFVLWNQGEPQSEFLKLGPADLKFSRDSKLLVAGDYISIVVFDVSTRSTLVKLAASTNSNYIYAKPRHFRGRLETIEVGRDRYGELMISPDSKYAAWLSPFNNAVTIYSIYKKSCDVTFYGGRTEATPILSPDFKLLGTWTVAAGLQLWDTFSGQLLESLLDCSDYSPFTRFSNDSKMIILDKPETTDRPGTVSFYTKDQSGDFHRAHKIETGRSYGISPDLRRAIVLSSDGWARVWDWKEGSPQIVKVFRGVGNQKKS